MAYLSGKRTVCQAKQRDELTEMELPCCIVYCGGPNTWSLPLIFYTWGCAKGN